MCDREKKMREDRDGQHKDIDDEGEIRERPREP